MLRALQRHSWIAVLLLAAAVRLPDVTAARPYMNYVDDGNYLHAVARMLRDGRWEPGWYNYPTLPLTTVALGMRLYAPVYRAEHGRPFQQDITTGSGFYDLIEPEEILLFGRGLALLASVGTVLLTGLLARRLAGPGAGLLTAFCTALMPALAIRGGLAMVDSYAVLFSVACLFVADHLRTTSRPGWCAVWAGAMAGLTFASKYTAILVALAFAVTVLGTAPSWKARLRFWVLGGLGAVAAALAGIPGLVLNTTGVLGSLSLQRGLYSTLPSPSDFWSQTVRRAEWDIPYDHPEIGWTLLLLGVAGLVAALWDRRIAVTIRAWWVYILVFLAFFTRYGYQPFRNLLPLVPLLCVGIGLFVARLRERLPRPLWADAAAFVLIAALLGPPVTGYAVERWRLEDSRTQAVDWLAAHTGRGDTVLVLRELAIQPGELARLEAKVVPRRLDAARTPLLEAVPRFALLGEPLDQQGRPVIGPAFRRRLLDRYEIRARYGEHPTPGFAYWWHGNRQIVYVLERRRG